MPTAPQLSAALDGALGSVVESRTREVKYVFLGRTKNGRSDATVPLVVQGWPLGVSREAARSNGTSAKGRHVVQCEDGTLGVAVVADDRAERIHRGSLAALQFLMQQNRTWVQADEHAAIADYPSENSLELEKALIALIELTRRMGTRTRDPPRWTRLRTTADQASAVICHTFA